MEALKDRARLWCGQRRRRAVSGSVRGTGAGGAVSEALLEVTQLLNEPRKRIKLEAARDVGVVLCECGGRLGDIDTQAKRDKRSA